MLPLVLGTVQLGLPYGIANTGGQPDYAAARDLLAAAWECGVPWLDTAVAYGESEAVIGRALVELGLRAQFQIVTKVPDLAGVPPEKIPGQVEAAIRGSLQRLGLERLPAVLFHREADVRYLDALLRLRERGLVERVGVSVMTPEALAGMLDSGLEVVQLAASALDRRFARAGLLEELRGRGIVVHARSAYVQGLLLMPEAAVPAELADVLPIRRALQSLAGEAGISLGELALRFVLAEPGVTEVVVGAESAEQVRANAGYARRGPLPADLAEAVRRAVPVLPDELAVPHLWPRRNR
jgi:aryl-alcohol dehydrogenase-like predicted oxidoreductase